MYVCMDTHTHTCVQMHMDTQTYTCVYIYIRPDISVFLTMFCF